MATKEQSPDTSDISFRKNAKETKEIPKGAKIIKKETPRVEVEEIENGFLITRTQEIRYKVGENSDYMYMCKKWYTKTDPLTINVKDKELADLFDNE